MESNYQPAARGSGKLQNRKERGATPIRLNELIPKLDVKAGHRTVFGAIRATPDKQDHENEIIEATEANQARRPVEGSQAKEEMRPAAFAIGPSH